MLHVLVAYANLERQALYAVLLDDGATVRDAIERSGVVADFPEIDLTRNRVGIFGKLAALDDGLQDRDRVEILRPLVLDAKEARRRRVDARLRRTRPGSPPARG
jgi:putative ubiquitin-RnfH superfamily antitoxin RatB of RatAB toxin-antitoxin module